MRLKTKLTAGLIFLFSVILALGIFGIFYINRLAADSDAVLRNNENTIMYCTSMLGDLEVIPSSPQPSLDHFNGALVLQEANITEPGEGEATAHLRQLFEALRKNPADTALYPLIRRTIHLINNLNQDAILRKSAVEKRTALGAVQWLTIIVSVLTLVAFTFIVSFPGIISRPIAVLTEGIKAIAGKNYGKRIYLDQKDEFGEMAAAFNVMAEKLDEYEHSNLSRILFEKLRIEAIINQMRDAIIGFDEHLSVLFINSVAESLLGLKERDIQGLPASEVAGRNDLLRTLLKGDAPGGALVEKGSPSEDDDMKIFADGQESYFRKERLLIRHEGQRIGEVIILRNITPFYEQDEAKTNFIATISHELKTPLSSIKMSARLLDDGRIGELNEEQRELVQGISGDTNRLLRITGELLNMTQAETGHIQIQRAAISPGAIIEVAMKAVVFQARQKNIHIETDLRQGDLKVLADAEKSSWVLINYLSNAVRHSYEDSKIMLTVHPTPEGFIAFVVRDVGPGIEEKYLPRLFDKYFQVPGSHDKSGSGLGLAISKEFIEAQGGTVHVWSRIGEGSAFEFELPVAK